MKSSRPFVSIKSGDVEKITKGLIGKAGAVNAAVGMKMNSVVNIVWATAHARRPKITVQELKAKNLPRYFRKGASGKSKEYRVSDPNATLGVPVDTGKLQASIKKSVVKAAGGKWVGTVGVVGNIPYANAIEYGTSKMKARPFMRPAYNENKSTIKKIFEAPITKL